MSLTHDGDMPIIEINMGSDITGATTRNIIITYPNGGSDTHIGTVYNSNYLRYEYLTGLSKVATKSPEVWKVYVELVTSSGKDLSGDCTDWKIYNKGCS